MSWFVWKWWRIAWAQNTPGSVMYDGDGRWRHVAGRVWWRTHTEAALEAYGHVLTEDDSR